MRVKCKSASRWIGLASVLLLMILSSWRTVALAGEPFIGEMRWFAGNFPPRNWAFCDGQLLPISGHEALFSLLGTTYGGDGRTSFALPDMRGRFPLHAGRGPGLSNRSLGAKGGAENQTLTTSQLPSHSHTVNATTARGNQSSPTNNMLARQRRDRVYDSVSGNNPADVQMASDAVGTNGGGLAHNNRSPYIGISCIIALNGLFPPRN